MPSLLGVQVSPRRVRVQAFELTALISTGHTERIVEVTLPVDVHRSQPVYAAPRRLVRVDDKELHVPRRRERVARDDASPARFEVLPADAVNVTGVGGTLAQNAGVLLIQATVILAVRVPAAFDETDLSVHTLSGEPKPRAG
eukprot:COSAG06_NODE_10198_length_1729_cov_6.596319_3_plen_142_part_00